jgi:hypothetical protein
MDSKEREAYQAFVKSMQAILASCRPIGVFTKIQRALDKLNQNLEDS